MQTKLTLAALAAIVIATPAAAADQASSSQNVSRKQADAKERKYCIQYEEMTGSRTAPQVCKTKAQWARQGVYVDKPNQ